MAENGQQNCQLNSGTDQSEMHIQSIYRFSDFGMVGFPYKKRTILILITLKKEENNIQKFLNLLDALSCTDLLKRHFPGFLKNENC
ncbi:hypothetical protein GCM10011325_21560 [Dyadobacter sediminis]|nr:hypothetical protein GCM10011325_21560 [Dyadobacter sediminis]